MYEFLGNLTLDHWSGIVVVVLLSLFSYFNRDKVKIQPILGYLVYIILFPTKYGLGLMDRIANKYRELVKLYGYISIGIGFLGMLFITLTFFITVLMWIFRPAAEEASFALVLPFTNVPGIGYLSFWHFFISIFVLAFFHELAHGIVARAHNLKLNSTGFALLGVIVPLFPAAFVEPDENKMKKQKDVVQYSVFAAGPMANMVLAFIFGLLFAFVFAPIETGMTEPIGFTYEVIDEELYPSVEAGLPAEGIISSVNGKGVNDYSDFAREMGCVSPGDSITLGIDDENYHLTTIEHPEDDIDLGFIGITPIQNERRIIDEYEGWKASTFSWFTSLFKWLFLLNFAVGLINLLPMGPVDGGRMFGLALEKIMKDKEKAKKIWAFVGFVFLAIIILGLFITYVGNPLLLFN